MFHKKSDRNKAIKEAFSKIKVELEDHLDTINENTKEIESNYNYISEVETKIEKLNEKMDEILMFLNNNQELKQKKIKLTFREQEVFLVLYTAHDNLKLTFSSIAQRLGLTEELVKEYINSIIQKGIPLIKKYRNNITFISLDPKFKHIQAKNNLVDIDGNLRKEIIENLR